MGLIVGIFIVIFSTLGGYAAMGGSIPALWQPFEVVIIVGSLIGAYIIANSKRTLRGTGHAVGVALRGSRYDRESYVELLSALFMVLRVGKIRGNLGLESHVEKPTESPIFQRFPALLGNEVAMTFLRDYLRMLTLGVARAHEVEALMDRDIEIQHEEHHAIAHALQTASEALPALGIVAAVMGVIKTMGSITEPPEVLGHLIGGALVGTFLGVWLSYGVVGPVAQKAGQVFESELFFLHAIKSAILAHMGGAPPQVSVEFARKAIMPENRPDFYEIEEITSGLPNVK